MEEQIGRYEIRREIRRGGMATVYLAYDPRFKRQVAVKVLPRQFAHDPKYLARFEQEAQTIGALEHPAIVPVYDFGEYNDAPYLVMRYMAGGSLRDRLRGEPLALEDIIPILKRLAPALDNAHALGIIHRDLKPANILFDEDGRSYLADFGIARLAESSQTMSMVGTPAYMSPEQVKAERQLDSRSDLYALGVLLFELLSGRKPYEADTPAGQMLMHILEPVPDITQFNPALAPETQQVINQAMAKEPGDRYQSAVELATAAAGLAAQEQAPAAQLDSGPEKGTAAPAGDKSPAGLDGVLPFAATLWPVKGLARWLGPAGALIFLGILVWGISTVWPGMGRECSEERPPGSNPLAHLLCVSAAGEAAGAAFAGETPPAPGKAPPLRTPHNQAINEAEGNQGVPFFDAALGDSWTRPADDKTMRFIPAGSFLMGSESGDEDEAPMHEVRLHGFWIDETEVTNGQYGRCVAEGVCAPSFGAVDASVNGENHPVVGVSWFDAGNYCAWAGARLPTEAEWEYAARGPEGRKYPWGEEKPGCDVAQFGGCDGDTVPVGSLPGGAAWGGVMELAGNVWEWTGDWYGSGYYAISPQENPQGPQSGGSKVVRGGSWGNGILYLRGATRDAFMPRNKYIYVGFRCALSIK